MRPRLQSRMNFFVREQRRLHMNPNENKNAPATDGNKPADEKNKTVAPGQNPANKQPNADPKKAE